MNNPGRVVCPKCKYEWENKTPYPRKCPDCQVRWPLGRETKGETTMYESTKYPGVKVQLGDGPMASYNSVYCDICGEVTRAWVSSWSAGCNHWTWDKMETVIQEANLAALPYTLVNVAPDCERHGRKNYTHASNWECYQCRNEQDFEERKEQNHETVR